MRRRPANAEPLDADAAHELEARPALAKNVDPAVLQEEQVLTSVPVQVAPRLDRGIAAVEPQLSGPVAKLCSGTLGHQEEIWKVAVCDRKFECSITVQIDPLDASAASVAWRHPTRRCEPIGQRTALGRHVVGSCLDPRRSSGWRRNPQE